jgi:hypothetical protein
MTAAAYHSDSRRSTMAFQGLSAGTPTLSAANQPDQ